MTTTRRGDPLRARSREELAALTAAGARPKWLMFWGHRPQRDGGIGAGALSQWWPSAFTVQGVRHATAEHWMMAGKARLFGDEASVPRILAARTPAEAKNLGRLVRGFDEERWSAARFELVVTGSTAKFGQPPCATTCWAPAAGCWWRPARWTGSGASDWRPRTSGHRTRGTGAG